MISQMQYERLEYFIDTLKLTYEELRLIDDFIANPQMDDGLDWLIETLRKRPRLSFPSYDVPPGSPTSRAGKSHRLSPGTFSRILQTREAVQNRKCHNTVHEREPSSY
jgi:hypothetical protein